MRRNRRTKLDRFKNMYIHIHKWTLLCEIKQKCKLALAQMSILNSHILSNKAVSNSQSLRDTETLSLLCQNRERCTSVRRSRQYDCVGWKARMLLSLFS